MEISDERWAVDFGRIVSKLWTHADEVPSSLGYAALMAGIMNYLEDVDRIRGNGPEGSPQSPEDVFGPKVPCELVSLTAISFQCSRQVTAGMDQFPQASDIERNASITSSAFVSGLMIGTLNADDNIEVAIDKQNAISEMLQNVCGTDSKKSIPLLADFICIPVEDVNAICSAASAFFGWYIQKGGPAGTPIMELAMCGNAWFAGYFAGLKFKENLEAIEATSG